MLAAEELIIKFEKSLIKKNLSDNTIKSYLWTVRYFYLHYDAFTKNNLLRYKDLLMKTCKPSTVNNRIQAINKYCEFIKRKELQLNHIKVQSKPFIDKVISNADYNYLKKCLKKDENWKWYYIIWFMASTGARVGEVIKFKVEDVLVGYIDLYAKGGKLRRIYIPMKIQKELILWLEKENIESGYIFRNKNNVQISIRGIEKHLKVLADKYGLDKTEIYPHSFRHRYAINFLEKNNNLAFLADILGHSNIETTRLYLRKTATEQRNIINNTVTW